MTGLPGVCVVCAVRRETLGLRRRVRPWRSLAGSVCPAWVIGDAAAVVLESGVGCVAANRALSWLLDTGWTGHVISAGFCGSLAADVAVGDLIRATEIVDADGSVWPASWPETARISCRAGRLVTAHSLVGAPASKKALGQLHNAIAVEMESAALARLCNYRRLSYISLRVVSDSMDTALSPELVGLLGRGRVSMTRLACILLRRPAISGELWRLGRITKDGAEKLGAALEILLDRLPRQRSGGEPLMK